MRKIACVIGARPQFIKHFPLELSLSKKFQVASIHTGQHYDQNMSEVFFEELGLTKPLAHFSLQKKSQGAQTGEMLEKIEKVFVENSFDAILVYGDTNSTLAGALVASKLNIPVIHVEAGLRSYNRDMPEEINRVLTDHISSLLFCSSPAGMQNLAKEGVTKNIFISGDLMRDSLKMILPKVSESLRKEPYILVTLHRPYNTDSIPRLKNILSTLDQYYTNIVFPIHPRTYNLLDDDGFNFDSHKHISFERPFGYLDMMSHLKYAHGIITDSGGMQKEAYWLKKPCLTLRSETEWVETLEGSWNRLVFDDLSELGKLPCPIETDYNQGLYGSGDSAEEIVGYISSWFDNEAG